MYESDEPPECSFSKSFRLVSGVNLIHSQSPLSWVTMSSSARSLKFFSIMFYFLYWNRISSNFTWFEITIFEVPSIRSLYPLVLQSVAKPRLIAATAFRACHPFSHWSLFRCIYALQPKGLNLDISFLTPWVFSYGIVPRRSTPFLVRDIPALCTIMCCTEPVQASKSWFCHCCLPSIVTDPTDDSAKPFGHCLYGVLKYFLTQFSTPIGAS